MRLESGRELQQRQMAAIDGQLHVMRARLQDASAENQVSFWGRFPVMQYCGTCVSACACTNPISLMRCSCLSILYLATRLHAC